jgi:hypothetical protein
MTMSPTNMFCQSTFTTAFTALGPIFITKVIEGTTVFTVVYDTSTTESIDRYTASDGEVLTAWIRDDLSGIQLKSPTTLTSGTARAGPMTVYWQSSDLSNFPSAYAASLASLLNLTLEATTTSSTVSSTPIPGPSGTPGPTATSLSTGAKVGISVGTALGSLALSIVLIMLFLRHRRRKRAAQDSAVPEMSGVSSGFRSFVNGAWRSEAEGKSDPVEMDSRNVNVIPGPPVELDAAR